MISEVVMPQMGADMTEGTIVRWLKHDGDAVARGEVIAEIETDKANIEIEAFEGGVFRKTLASEGDVVAVGGVIAIIASADDDLSKYANGASAPAASPTAAVATPDDAARSQAKANEPRATNKGAVVPETNAPPRVATDAERAPTPAAPTAMPAPQPIAADVQARTDDDAGGHRTRVSPVARRMADERGIDLRSLHGSGPDGRIIKRDVEAAATGGAAGARPAAPADGARGSERAVAPGSGVTATGVGAPQPLRSKMRLAIARRMSQSKREAPHYYLLLEIDMTDAMALREQANATIAADSHVSVNDLIVRACALALQRYPVFNATISGDEITRYDAQNVCIGIAMDDGLIAPAILDAGRKSLVQIAVASKDLIARAKGGRLRADEISAGTFTISNLGSFGVETLIAIIQPPQTAILGVGAVSAQAVVRDGAVVVRQMMKVALSADHRVTDGAQGAQFLAEIKRPLEAPLLLVL